jgi:hypothetical protein
MVSLTLTGDSGHPEAATKLLDILNICDQRLRVHGYHTFKMFRFLNN